MEQDFSTFRKKMKEIRRVPVSGRSYDKYGYGYERAVKDCFTLEEIKEIIKNGDPVQLRQLSRYYYRTNGVYRNSILLMANMPMYDTFTIPIYNVNDEIDEQKIYKGYLKVCNFIDKLNVPLNFRRITQEMLVAGVYFGIKREVPSGITIQDLPVDYCRTRFRDYHNLDIPEFNVLFFDTIYDEKLREEAVAGYPEVVQKAWHDYKRGNTNSQWVMIMPEDGGLCFTYGDKTPLFVSSIPQIYKLEEAIDREAKRDENELYKLLIQKMPIDNKGELVFQLDEVADIHASVADMLADDDTIDVLTTFGDTNLESLQDSAAASQSADRINKYETSAYNNIGLSSSYFNADSASSMKYSIAKDEALMNMFLSQYSTWIKLQINSQFAQGPISYDFMILNTTNINKLDTQNQLFRGAQYGYSKLMAGVALGIKQIDMTAVTDFENRILGLTGAMLPLQSTYTSSYRATEEETMLESQVTSEEETEQQKQEEKEEIKDNENEKEDTN